MSMFSRQPQLPDERPKPPASSERVVPDSVKTPVVMGHFAIVGVDTKTGEPISTVLEARSEDEAQEIAHQQGIIVDEFSTMHPLAGAAAVQMARNDPNDRFNQHPGYADADQSTATPQTRDEPHVGNRPLIAGRDIPQAMREAPPNSPVGVFAILGVIVAIGGFLYLTVVQGGGLQQVVAAISPAPAEVQAAFDVTEPLGVDLSQIEGLEQWSSDPSADPDKQGRLRLEAIVPPTTSASGDRGSAVIGGKIITPGQSVSGYRLVQVRRASVLLQKGNKLIELRLDKLKNPFP